MDGEHRVVDEATGGAKGSKLARFDLMPWDVLREVAEHFGRGARKYADRNWERGYKWSLSFAALHRHLAAFWHGEDIDSDPELVDEDGVSRARHIIAVVWHAMVLAYFSARGAGTDDRPLHQRIDAATSMPAQYVEPAEVLSIPRVLSAAEADELRAAWIAEHGTAPDIAGRDIDVPVTLKPCGRAHNRFGWTSVCDRVAMHDGWHTGDGPESRVRWDAAGNEPANTHEANAAYVQDQDEPHA